MGDLRALAVDGFAALPRRGLEIGGVLLGENRGGEIRLRGFEELPCEHVYGPSYTLSEKERAALSSLLAARQGRGGRPRVVGFFQSFVARAPAIEEADEEFVRRHFPFGDFVYLLLQPLSAATCVASFRFFHNGMLLPEGEAPSFVLETPQTPDEEGEEKKIEWPLLRPASQPPPTPEDLGEPARPEEPQTAANRARWWIPLAILAFLAANAAVVSGLWIRSRGPRWAELHLDAHAAGGQLDVRWDSGAARALGATAGVLAVSDGDTRQNIALSEEQLRAGKYRYTPTHENLGLRLMLYRRNSAVAGDAVRLESALDAALLSQAVPPPAPSMGDSDRAAPVSVPAVSPPAPARVAVRPVAVHEVQPEIPAGIRARIHAPIAISVDIDVAEDGRVARARAETRFSDDVLQYLADQAQIAARQWRFKPARTTGGAAAAAATTIQFTFTPAPAEARSGR